MSDNKPTPSGISGIVTQVFDYIGDKPIKAVILVSVILIGGIAWVLYEHRDQIIESWLTPSAPSLKTNMISEALETLVAESGADMIQIWAVDLSSNTQSFLAARHRDGERPVMQSPRSLPIIVRVSDAQALVDALHGNPVCIDMLETGTPLARRLKARGMDRACAIPIPPDPSAFVGIIYLAWRKTADPSTEEVAVKVARGIAAKLATH